MDDEIEIFETELKGLQPARPSAELERRLAAELTTAVHHRRRRALFMALSLPAAAAIAALMILPWNRDRSPVKDSSSTNRSTLSSATSATSAAATPSTDVLKPVSAENILYAVTDEGTVTLDDGSVARRERLQSVDTIRWQNSNTHASLTWSIPREEVRVIPVRYQ